ncbi:MAG: helix-turn-helix domain-containing protein [Aeromicrobium sp.]
MSQRSDQQPDRTAPIEVGLVVDEGSNPFEMACACEIFGARRRPEIGFEPYRLRLVSPEPEVAMRDGLFTVTGSDDLSALDEVHTVIVPNRPDVDSPSRRLVLDALVRAHERGARLVGLCTGAYTLAEAGLLDGRSAAVHWQLADDFARRFPAVRVEPDVLFVDEDDILTSSGSAAALDLGLHIVRKDHGSEVANFVSRRLVFASFRDGGQRQFVEQPVPDAATPSLGPTLDWLQEHLAEDLDVAAIADRAHMSPATLHRRFRAEVGTTPLAWLTAQRVQLARRLLERSGDGLDLVAHRSGLGTAANLRSQMHRHTGVSPSAYRARFHSAG